MFADQKREPFIMMGMVELIHNVIHDNEACTVQDIVRSFSSLDDWGLHDWALMCELLLDDGDESLENDQKETLLKILTASLSVCPDEDLTSRKKKVGAHSILDIYEKGSFLTYVPVHLCPRSGYHQARGNPRRNIIHP